MGRFRLELFIARKFLKTTGSGFLSFLTGFSVAGIFIGVATLIVVLGVMTGFHRELKERILGMNPHILVTRFYDLPFVPTDSLLNSIDEEEEVIGIVPYAYIKSMVRADGYTDGAVVKGIPPGDSLALGKVKDLITLGKGELNNGEVLLGVALASNLRVLPGDTISLFSLSKTEVTPLGTTLKPVPFTVSGIFDAGLYDYNATLIIASLDDVKNLLGLKKEVSGLEVYIRDPYKAKTISKRINNRISYPLRAVSWINLNRSLFSALKLEKLAMFIILTLIIIVASFSVVATLMFLVTNKTREIGALRAMGISAKGIMRVFIFVGLFVGLIGTFLGAAFGILLGEMIERISIGLPQDVYFISKLPVLISGRDIALVVSAAFLIVLLATIYPARKAARLKPVDALRYE